MFDVCAGVESSGVGMVLGRWSRSGGGKPTFPPPNPSRPSLKAPCGQPPLASFGRHPPPIFPLLSSPSAAAAPLHSQVSCSSHLLNPSRHPPISSSPSVVLPRRIFFVWVQVSIGELVGGRKEEKGGTQGDLEVIYVFALKFNWLYVYLCESVEVLSRIFVGGRTAVVLGISGNFSWAISGDQWENHVELCHTFPTSTYALDSEL